MLETERLVLRNFRAEDLGALHAYRNSEVCARYQRGQDNTYSALTEMIALHAKDHLHAVGKQQFAIARKDTGEIAGDLTLYMEEPTITVGYTISNLHHRKGYAFEMLSALTEELHRLYPVREVVALVDPRNTPSMNLLKKLQFEELGYVKQIDSHIFAKWAVEEMDLVTPTEEYAQQIEAFRREVFEANDADAFAGCSFLEDFERAEDWLTFLGMPDDSRVPSDVFLAVRRCDGRVVGMIDIRHHIDHPILGLWGGHIGYTVRPDERGKGYAKEMLRQDLHKARELGLKKVLVTCSPDNPASERTIIANGGVMEKEITVNNAPIRRYWIQL